MTYTVMTTTYMMLAILFEVAGITSMKLSDGFHHIAPSIFIFVFYSFSFVFLTLTLKRLELSFVYAIWAGLGTSLIAIIGVFCFHEPMTWLKVLFLSMIITGIMGLKTG